MVSTKNTTFIVAPGFNKYDTALKEMIFPNEMINLSMNSIKNVIHSTGKILLYSTKRVTFANLGILRI